MDAATRQLIDDSRRFIDQLQTDEQAVRDMRQNLNSAKATLARAQELAWRCHTALIGRPAMSGEEFQLVGSRRSA